MKYKQFLEIIMSYKKFNEDISELFDLGFDLSDFSGGKYNLSKPLDIMFNAAFSSHYTKEGVEWIDWFIFENEYGQKDWSKIKRIDEKGNEIEENRTVYGAQDKDGNPIAYSYESLWEMLEKDYKCLSN